MMKSLKVLLFSLLIIFSGQSFSMSEFINFLQESGYYYIIEAVKIYLGDDFAIKVCVCLVKNKNNCEELVKVYINDYTTTPNSDNSKGPKRIGINLENVLNATLAQINASNYFKNLIREIFQKVDNGLKKLIIILLQNYQILQNKKREKDIIEFIMRITGIKIKINSIKNKNLFNSNKI